MGRRMDWSRVRHSRQSFASEENAIRAGMRADRENWLKEQREAPRSNIVKPDTGRPTYRVKKHTTEHEIWIVVGADCPWNVTPGTRQVYHFRNRTEAQNAGFPYPG
jgi:hypothetical protein